MTWQRSAHTVSSKVLAPSRYQQIWWKLFLSLCLFALNLAQLLKKLSTLLKMSTHNTESASKSPLQLLLTTACDAQSWQGAWNVRYFEEKSGIFLKVIFLFQRTLEKSRNTIVISSQPFSASKGCYFSNRRVIARYKGRIWDSKIWKALWSNGSVLWP